MTPVSPPPAGSYDDSDFRATASLERLRFRAALLRRTRDFFDGRGLLEVETPLLSADVVVDRHLEPFAVDCPAGNAFSRRYWLQTSPEFGMKRLLASGARAIYQITRSFRQGECGPLHNPEFTIVEWYCAGHDMAQGIELLSDLADTLLERGPAQPMSYAEAFEQFAGLDPHRAPIEQLVAAARAGASAPPASLSPDDRDSWLDWILIERVQPHLGIDRPAILYDYPAAQAALARIRPDDPPVAERFELFVSGHELANGYHELLDPAELRRRNAEANRQRRADGSPELPEESRLLAAMQAGLPPCTGVALGFDRLVMLLAGAQRIDEVIAFPFDRA